MGQLVKAQGQVKMAKKMQKTLPLVTFPLANAKPQTKNFFSVSTRRLAESVEGFNSSLALAAGDLWPKKDKPIYCLAWSLKG